VTAPCPLCASGGPTLHREEEGGRYFRCGRCGLVFLHPRPSPGELERLYQREEGATFHHGAEIREAYEKRLEARLRLRVLGPALRSAPSRTALEIGCGGGYLLDLLRRSGWSVSGTEMADDYVRFARGALGLDVGRDFPRDRRFGAVLLFNVLSHLHDPPDDLARCREALLPRGVLVLETGNAAEVEPSRAGPLGAPEHLWHFSEASLRLLLGRLGFRDVRVRRFNVEWQRGALRRLGRRGAGKPADGPPRESARPRPGRDLLRRLAAHVLLGLRFGLGRFLADRRHACTLFAAARR